MSQAIVTLFRLLLGPLGKPTPTRILAALVLGLVAGIAGAALIPERALG